jgi:predicted ribosomally synthesized peptide with SipW-like signal peptide
MLKGGKYQVKKIGLIGLALLLALGALGVTFAGWTDTVTVTGTVETGEVCVQWYTENNTDICNPMGTPANDYTIGNMDWNLNVTAITGDADGYPAKFRRYQEDKNVACTTVTGLDTDTLLVTVDNAYPLYAQDIEIEWINCGTIPVKIQDITITPLNFTLADAAWTPNNGGHIFVEVTNGIGYQLEPGDRKAHSLIFVVQQAALQNAGEAGGPLPAYQFLLEVDVIQWNEYENGG